MGPTPPADVLADLEARGLVHDTTDRDALARRLASPVTVYHGIDPTADSLHVGNLVGVLALRRFQAAGHRPVALAGGATGMIGDPGGRAGERALLDPATLAANLRGIEAQLRGLLAFEAGGGGSPGGTGGQPAVLVDNASWTAGLRLVDFLRDVGKHATVNQMIAKESIRSRLESRDGISFAEFSYMLIQAHDYLWLHQHEACDLQIGGSDQWGNITAGIDLIRRRTGAVVHGLTWPLLTRDDGSKLGKSVGGNVWLDPRRTSTYAFYQHWMQVDDAEVRRLLLQLTFLDVAEVDAIAAAHAGAPERREAQRRLASEVTAIVHGVAEAVAAEAASQILFGGRPGELPEAAYRALQEEVPTTAVDPDRLAEGLDLVAVLAETGLSTSRSDARRSLGQGAVYVNDRRVADDDPVLSAADVRHGRWILLRRGRRQHHLLRLGRE
ncbi:MAG: tyrosine--tRNA ligase [Actinomycetota bacterium]|nr:tyrosine--tRNA ligase [Actinomycetota bacterium]